MNKKSLWMSLNLMMLLLGFGGVAFITLLERKLLAMSQSRLGPNKTSMMSLMQPISDGIKLLSKTLYTPHSSQTLLFFAKPTILIISFCVIWTFNIVWMGNIVQMNTSSLLLFVMLGMGSYGIILSSWSIMSSFSKLGSLRSVLQSLSYEVAMILVFMIMLTVLSTLTIKTYFSSLLEMSSTWLMIWITLSLMECNRAPFDLMEGESELISGFNIEMGSTLFVYLFLTEYGMIMVLMLMAILLMNLSLWMILMLCSLALVMRSCFPRIRYDILSSLMWHSLLAVSLLLFMMYTTMKHYLMES